MADILAKTVSTVLGVFTFSIYQPPGHIIHSLLDDLAGAGTARTYMLVFYCSFCLGRLGLYVTKKLLLMVELHLFTHT